ncbi:MAG: hypothetical protein AAF757_04560 [Cyanobacteria bacterium P01_D01_bin.116]
MSSASKGRYQSRLFNFFHKQSRRFGEGFGRSLRQLRVAASWSLEAFSKSIYLLLQKAADSAGTQLPGTVGETQLKLQPSEAPVSDSAIVQVLENVETRYITSTTPKTKKLSNQITSLECSSQKIRGVASQLYSQNLVLVTAQNEILDVLTPSQQQAIENQIISEIANYWRSWRLSQENQSKRLSLLSFKANSFLKRLAPGNSNSNSNAKKREKKYLQINPATVASLDTVVANLETNALVPVSRAQIIVKQRGSKIIQAVRAKLDIFFYGDSQVTVSKKQVIVDGNVETQKSKIQALISAALKYFYAEPEAKKIKQVPPRPLLSSTQSKSPQQQIRQSEDDWLSSADLFGNGFPQLNPRNKELNKLKASQKQLNSSTQIKDSSEKLFGRFQLPNWRTLRLKEKAGLQQPKKSTLQKQQNAYINSQNSQEITINPNSELQNSSQAKITQTQSSESTEIEAKPEWIETKAEIVGYQKHPLEQILIWIDNTMLKIEEAFVQFATALQQFFRK